MAILLCDLGFCNFVVVPGTAVVEEEEAGYAVVAELHGEGLEEHNAHVLVRTPSLQIAEMNAGLFNAGAVGNDDNSDM